ncbi:NACHT domain-containing protein [Coleofasciculus sp. FACHB-SPT36]|uniref:NACHT domain-containing protein n=1 Tax=Cyanophyceae TaxID=3028117 RepID=UPI00168A45CF|nr:NACHT domain-containing protein [Coleofasciculus sp. FACHB-SPT36]MBD2538677.1 XRE family transcriptional regulator [Coleofasciculus sp. FACHB-SPT36]
MLPSDSDRVQSSAEGKVKLEQAYQEANLTQEKLAQKANVSLETVKQLLGTRTCPNGVKKSKIKEIAKVLKIEPTDIVDPKEWYRQQQLPSEFEPLIEEKIKAFCGRKFVFEAFKEFLQRNPKGYFTVVGDAGMGKSAIAAKYVHDYHSPCYFNILAERRNRPELFLKSIRQQLINRYQLQDAGDADLPTLVSKVVPKLPSGESLVIVVDALDEVEQESGAENLLYLPKELPERVYFLLTRRPYNQEKKRLTVSPGVPVQELDLRAEEYVDYSHNDIKEYIRLSLNCDPDYKDGLKKWIQDRNIYQEEFVEQVAAKSENNFMYLRYVLPGITRGFYDDLSLKQLPDGLQDYYQTHWVRMNMDAAPNEIKAIALFILVEIGTPIPGKMIAAIADRDEYEVESVLDEWVEYLRRQEIQGELCYTIYHASFLDFLSSKREMKKSRKLFQEVNQRIVDYLEKEMA